jgi:hypothetical protein
MNAELYSAPVFVAYRQLKALQESQNSAVASEIGFRLEHF